MEYVWLKQKYWLIFTALLNLLLKTGSVISNNSAYWQNLEIIIRKESKLVKEALHQFSYGKTGKQSKK